MPFKADFKDDTDFEPEIVCPWCGYIAGDSFEHSDGEEECDNCDRKYDVSSDWDVTYSTTKIEPKTDDVTGQ